MTTSTLTIDSEVRHAHLFCGIGGGAIGFNRGQARVGALRAKPVCLGGIDVDPPSCRDFERNVGVPATCLDLFTLEQYLAFHRRMPPAGWREAVASDVRRAFRWERPDVAFLSAPCKGFSGLLSERSSKTDKYQALNGLTLRGIRLLLEAYADDPVSLLVFENVPRIATRGRFLLDQIIDLLRAGNYAVAETTHDCGELGGLGQSRKRFLLVARHEAKVPAFLYEPAKQRLLGVGQVLERLPMPLSGEGGAMHRMPALQWKTWARLAFVRAGADWRSLNDLAVVDGHLRDYGIVPETEWHRGVYGVREWHEPSGTVTSRSSPSNGTFAVADPREVRAADFGGLRVNGWDQHAGAVTTQRSPGSSGQSVADPRGLGPETHKNVLRVREWKEPGGTVTSGHSPTNGAQAVADPRIDQTGEYGQLGVREWDKPAGAVTAQALVGGGRNAVADPRLEGPRFNHAYRIVEWEQPAPGISSARGALAAVSDPRPPGRTDYKTTKYRVTGMDEASGSVIGASTTGNGAYAVADARFKNWHPGASSSKLRITPWNGHARPVTGAQQVASGAGAVADPRFDGRARSTNYGVKDWSDPANVVAGESYPTNGAFSVADPRPVALSRPGRKDFAGGGHYGVVGWDETGKAVVANGSHDNGFNSVADPRAIGANQDENLIAGLPAPEQRLVCVIVALDGTWHRPFTTLELAALQGFVDPDEKFELDGLSDSAWRERIGNAVPPPSAQAIADVMYETILLARAGETFTLSSKPIWVRDVAVALSLKPQEMPSW